LMENDFVSKYFSFSISRKKRTGVDIGILSLWCFASGHLAKFGRTRLVGVFNENLCKFFHDANGKGNRYRKSTLFLKSVNFFGIGHPFERIGGNSMKELFLTGFNCSIMCSTIKDLIHPQFLPAIKSAVVDFPIAVL